MNADSLCKALWMNKKGCGEIQAVYSFLFESSACCLLPIAACYYWDIPLRDAFEQQTQNVDIKGANWPPGEYDAKDSSVDVSNTFVTGERHENDFALIGIQFYFIYTGSVPRTDRTGVRCFTETRSLTPSLSRRELTLLWMAGTDMLYASCIQIYPMDVIV